MCESLSSPFHLGYVLFQVIGMIVLVMKEGIAFHRFPVV